MMHKSEKIERLTQARQKATALIGNPERTKAPEWITWKRNTEVLLERALGKGSTALRDFGKVTFGPMMITTRTQDSTFQKTYEDGMRRAVALLDSILDEVESYERPEHEEPRSSGPVREVERICRRFPAAARELALRHGGRSPMTLADEYDVQDVMRAFLRLSFDDVRPEEWTPSYAGSSSRMDFLLKDERIVIEAKKTRTRLGPKELRDELAVDIDRYRAHADCRILFCFVYDPDHRVTNPSGFERDLTGQRTESLDVIVIVAPHG